MAILLEINHKVITYKNQNTNYKLELFLEKKIHI